MAFEQGVERGSQHDQNTEQDFWATIPGHNAAASSMRFDYPEQALLQRSLHLMQLLQEGGTENQIQNQAIGTADPTTIAAQHLHAGGFDTTTMKRELGDENLQCNDEPYLDAVGRNIDCDQRPRSNTSSTATTLPSRPHAAVEKRYRRTVNTKLQQLHAAIPASGTFSLDPAERFRPSLDGSEPEQAAKPVVLDRAIQYTTHLIETYRKHDNEIETLRRQVREWLGEDGSTASPTSITKSVG